MNRVFGVVALLCIVVAGEGGRWSERKSGRAALAACRDSLRVETAECDFLRQNGHILLASAIAGASSGHVLFMLSRESYNALPDSFQAVMRFGVTP